MPPVYSVCPSSLISDWATSHNTITCCHLSFYQLGDYTALWEQGNIDLHLHWMDGSYQDKGIQQTTKSRDKDFVFFKSFWKIQWFHGLNNAQFNEHAC